MPVYKKHRYLINQNVPPVVINALHARAAARGKELRGQAKRKYFHASLLYHTNLQFRRMSKRLSQFKQVMKKRPRDGDEQVLAYMTLYWWALRTARNQIVEHIKYGIGSKSSSDWRAWLYPGDYDRLNDAYTRIPTARKPGILTPEGTRRDTTNKRV